MVHKTILVLAVLSAASLAACQTAVPFDPERPRDALMRPPERAPRIKKGEDLYDNNAKVRASHGRVSDQVRGLQGYIRTLLKHSKKQKGDKT